MVIIFKLLGTKMVLYSDSIAKAIECLLEGGIYQEGWKRNYDSHVTRALYKENAEKVGDQKATVYNLMCERARIWANIIKNSYP